MGNFGSIVTQNYASLYQRMSYKDLFQTLQRDRSQYVEKDQWVKILSKILF